jgi:3',5'-cyclic AMP phosphodiesterase CpdA
MVDRRAMIAALVSRINQLRPDLVFCVGDLITRYGIHKETLSTESIRWQTERVQELLLRLEVPLFVTIGNHDLAFDRARPIWRQYMGGGWDGSVTEDFSLNWGPYHLVALDCFVHYDDDNHLQEQSFRPAQLDWLQADLAAARNAARRVLFAHYDYRHQLEPLLGEMNLDAMFYGHAGAALYPEALQDHGILNGHLRGSDAYILAHVSGDEIVTEKATWSELDGD